MPDNYFAVVNGDSIRASFAQTDADLDLRVDMELDTYNDNLIYVRFATADSLQASNRWTIFRASWRDGTSTARFADSTAHGQTDGVRWHRQYVLKPNEGADSVVDFFERSDTTKELDDNTGWTALGSVTFVGVTGLFAQTLALAFGTSSGTGPAGKLYGLYLTNGAVTMNPDFRSTIQGNWGSPPVTDDFGNSWDVVGSPVYNDFEGPGGLMLRGLGK